MISFLDRVVISDSFKRGNTEFYVIDGFDESNNCILEDILVYFNISSCTYMCPNIDEAKPLEFDARIMGKALSHFRAVRDLYS